MVWNKINRDVRVLGEGAFAIVSYNLFGESLTNKMTIEEKPKGSGRVSHLLSGGRNMKTANAKALEEEYATRIQRRARRTMWVELSEEGTSRKR